MASRVGPLPCWLGLLVLWAGCPVSLVAQVRVNPTGVSVNAMNATTVFLTFGGVGISLRPAEAFWCGELMSAAPDRGSRCAPGTIYGQLPARYDLSRSSGVSGFTDIMSIPPSVARRAYQDARRGAVSTFFYVRRFENVAGGPSEFVAVTCRLTGGGAHTPFAFTDVRVHFEGSDEVTFVRAGEVLPPFKAEILYNGTGRLVGRWEVILPGEEGPTDEDLLTEASLPQELRTDQRRYSQVQRFNVFVPPGGTVTLPGPDPARLPTTAEGTYLVLLRVEATDDREGDSDLAAAGAGTDLVHSGAVAGFPLPVLRYVVLGDGSVRGADGATPMALLAPRDGAVARHNGEVRLVWSPSHDAAFYRVEIETASGATALGALLPRSVTHYELPSLVWQRPNASTLRWRVAALGGSGELLQRTAWHRIMREPATDAPAPSPAAPAPRRP